MVQIGLFISLLLVTFEPLDLEQSYIPHLKALMCGINAAEAQGCECMFTFCHAYPNMGVLLHKMAIVCNLTLLAVRYRKSKPKTKNVKLNPPRYATGCFIEQWFSVRLMIN